MLMLKFGDSGPKVELLRQILSAKKYMSGQGGNKYDYDCMNAVKRLQEENSLQITGDTGPDEWAVLKPYVFKYVTMMPNGIEAEFDGLDRRLLRAANPKGPEDGEIVVPFAQDVTSSRLSYSCEIMEYDLQGIRARYPFVEIGSIGRSVLGQELYTIRIGTGKRKIYMNGSHHANEWITSPLLVKFAEELAKGYVLGGRVGGIAAKNVFEGATYYITPMVNPDGVGVVTGQFEPGSGVYRLARDMSRGAIPFPSGWKANINGVDLNLNYPAGWENARLAKLEKGVREPGPRDFVGIYPLCEQETNALAAFTKEKDFDMVIAFHTQGEEIFWKYLNIEVGGAWKIAESFAQMSGYEAKDTPIAAGYAGYKDWFIEEFGRPGFTIEAGLGESPLPIDDFDDIYKRVSGIMAIAAVVPMQA